MNIENTQSQMRKGILEFCILSIIRRGEAYPSDIVEEMKAANAEAAGRQPTRSPGTYGGAVTTFPQLLDRRLTADPGQPLVTFSTDLVFDGRRRTGAIYPHRDVSILPGPPPFMPHCWRRRWYCLDSGPGPDGPARAHIPSPRAPIGEHEHSDARTRTR